MVSLEIRQLHCKSIKRIFQQRVVSMLLNAQDMPSASLSSADIQKAQLLYCAKCWAGLSQAKLLCSRHRVLCGIINDRFASYSAFQINSGQLRQ